jgi:hypothetical protein
LLFVPQRFEGRDFRKSEFSSGNSHQIESMPAAKLERPGRPRVVESYDVAADAKKRINLRNAKTKYFHVKALSNGCYVLEPRVLVPPRVISARTMKMIEQSAGNLKKGARFSADRLRVAP